MSIIKNNKLFILKKIICVTEIIQHNVTKICYKIFDARKIGAGDFGPSKAFETIDHAILLPESWQHMKSELVQIIVQKQKTILLY